MDLLQRTQIGYLKVDEAFIEVSSKYTNFTNFFLSKLTTELSKHIRIINHAIELIDDWQPPYSLTYSLDPVKLETLKIYIVMNNLANYFIKPFKSLVETPIFFNQKPNSSLRLYINYQSFNNLTIKNKYPLLLVE